MDMLPLIVNSAIMMMHRQWVMLGTLERPVMAHLSTPVRACLILRSCLEMMLHLVLLMSLLRERRFQLRERRWRFLITLWLYLGYRLAILHVLLAAVMVLLLGNRAVEEVLMLLVLLITWHATYEYVQADQKARDNLRQAVQLAGLGHEAAPGVAPAGLVANDDPADRVPNGPLNEAPAGQIQAGLDPTEMYLLVPSHSEPRPSSVPLWERDLASWRSMAKINHAIATVSYRWTVFVARAIGLRVGDRAEAE